MKSKGYNSRTSWIAAISCAVIGFLIAIPMRLAGYFFVLIIDNYDVDRIKATIPLVVFGVLRVINGPFISYLGHTFGLRATTTLGCVLASVGIGACYFAEEIIAIIMCLGFIYGTGFGFGISLIPEILKQHFIRDINMAIGIHITGCCLSAVIMPKILKFLTDEFGISGMFLILSAITLNSVPAAMLLEDPKNENLKSQSKHSEKVINQSPDNINKSQKEEKNYGHYNLAFPENIKRYEAEKEVVAMNKKDEKLDIVPHSNFSRECKQHIYTNIALDIDLDKSYEPNVQESVPKKDSFISLDPLKLDTDSIVEVNNQTDRNSAHNEDKCNTENCLVMPTIENPETPSKPKSKTWHIFQLFLDPTFFLTMFVQSSHGFVTTLTWTILVDFARDKGISTENSLYFLMFLPIAEMFGNLCLNWITDRNYLSRINYCIACYLILGVDLLFMVWFPNFTSIMIGVLIFGCFSGSLLTTFPGIVFDFFAAEHHSMALASRFCLYAFLCVLKTPIVGYFRGTLGSYNWVFYCIIISCVSCAILVKFTPLLAARRKKKNQKNKISFN